MKLRPEVEHIFLQLVDEIAVAGGWMAGSPACIRFEVEDVTFTMDFDQVPKFRFGPTDRKPTLRVTMPEGWLVALRGGHASPRDALQLGAVQLEGDPLPLIAIAETLLQHEKYEAEEKRGT